MKIFILKMEGQGDIDIRVVDEETYNWITGPSGRPPTNQTCWTDPFVPKSQLELMEADGDIDLPIAITSGSFENDRAICAQTLPVYASIAGFTDPDDADDTEKVIRKLAKELGDEVAGVWEGCIY